MATSYSIFYKIQADAQQAMKVFNTVSGKLNKMKESVNKVGDHLTKVGAVGTLGFATVLNKTLDFNRALNNLQAVSGASSVEIGALRDQAYSLGKATIFSAKEVVDAQSELAKGGFKTNEVMVMTKQVLDLAAASGMGMAESSTILTNAIQSMGLQAKDAGRAVDVMAMSANISMLGLEDFSQIFQNAGAVSRKAGLGIEGLASAMSVVRDTGAQASVASTNFKTGVLKMMHAVKKGSTALASLGIDANKAYDKGGVLEVLSQIHDKTKNLKSRVAMGKLSDIFGLEAYSTMSTIIDKIDIVKQREKILQKSQGSASKMAQVQLQGLVGTWENFKGAIETSILLLGGGAGFTGTLTKMLNVAIKVLDWFDNLNPAIKNFIGSALAMMPLVLGLGLGLKGVASMLGLTVFIFRTAIAPFFLFGKAIRGITIAWELFNLAVESNPIMMAIMGMITVAVVFYEILNNWKAVLTWIEGTFKKIMAFLSTNWFMKGLHAIEGIAGLDAKSMASAEKNKNATAQSNVNVNGSIEVTSKKDSDYSGTVKHLAFGVNK